MFFMGSGAMTDVDQVSASATKIPVSQMTSFQPPADVSAAGGGERETIIEPTKGWIGINWREMFQSRELLYFLVWRDLKVRYKQAVLGVGWVVLQPVMNMILFTLVFGSAAGLNQRLKDHANEYSVFVYAALLPWQLFATAISSGGMSLVNQQNIVKKIYFPRLYVPTAAVGGALTDMAISFVIVMGLAAFKHVSFSPLMLLMLPLVVLLALLNALGVAYLLSALTVRYRDFRFLIPFMSQVLMFVSFVAFPPSLVGNSKWKWLLLFNPMYGVVAAFRKCILNFPDEVTGFAPQYLVSSVIGGLLLFWVGLFVFRRTERNFADIA
ncbi:MAG: type transporter [Phycisphaerales bacterium]|nr:type transporter [Phycisphaerales bacterium]